MFEFIKKMFGTAQSRFLNKYWKVVHEINRHEEKLQSLTDEELRHKTVEFRERLKAGASIDSLLSEAYAVVKSACRRLTGTEVHVSGYDQKWDMIPFDVQLLAGTAMHYGCIAEMQTGEGKTLTAILPLYLNALTGKPVHLVTVNDYLAHRDCQWVGTILRWLGLTTGAITSTTPPEKRKEIYNNDVVYGTASEFGFDYLRDNSMAHSKQEQVQRGFYFCIIDEVDSILIDEARTPLIISGPVPTSRQMYDSLKQGVGDLVRKQRDLCNRLATEARKTLDKLSEEVAVSGKKSKPQIAEEEAALRKLWLVSKGTPHNKILKKIKEDPDMRAGLDGLDLYFYAEQNKEEKADALSELYIVIDEKSNEFELTDKGIAAWEECGGHADDFVMLDLGHEYLGIDENHTLDEAAKIQHKLAIQEEDAKRKERAHNLRQLLRAHLLMERDIDYIAQDDKIIIIDENTGRPQPGRRFSDGLHQAIEAKEGVSIQKETQTYATITLQNYFRMYKKLSGMTGTAATEAHEFKQIYTLEVLIIPTHRNCKRADANDEIYMTEREKYNAILKAIRAIHEQGRPILVGTESVEVSEKLSRILRQNQLEHTVLNAKQNDKEAEVIAHAGKLGAITIATNMAGRGTDIKLDPGIPERGGLHVIGTTRHRSRRIDRQLRGRCARLGDPGSSQFYIALEDPLMRMFASPRLAGILQKVRPPEGEPISSRMLNHSIETAQKRVEQRNYTMRKHTLEYDDVMNKQRQEIYSFRNEVLHTADMEPIATALLESVCHQGADLFLKNRSAEEGWNPEGYRQWLMQHFPVSFEEGLLDQDLLDKEELAHIAFERVQKAFIEKMAGEAGKIPKIMHDMPQMPTPSVSEGLRYLFLHRIDPLWQEHLHKMDHLRADVTLRSVGQRDPLTEFKHEAFTLFHDFSSTLRVEIAQRLFRFEIVVRPPLTLQSMLPGKILLETSRSFLSELENKKEDKPTPAHTPFPHAKPAEENKVVSIGAFTARAGRNELCPCGSGKKYKKCCAPLTEET